MRPEDQVASRIRSTKGSLTARSLVSRKYALPSARRANLACKLVRAGLYSSPAAVNASGWATAALKEEASSAVISGISTSARRGSPSADCTVKRPSESAYAPDPDKLSSAKDAAATAVLCQRCDLTINLKASGAQGELRCTSHFPGQRLS